MLSSCEPFCLPFLCSTVETREQPQSSLRKVLLAATIKRHEETFSAFKNFRLELKDFTQTAFRRLLNVTKYTFVLETVMPMSSIFGKSDWIRERNVMSCFLSVLSVSFHNAKVETRLPAHCRYPQVSETEEVVQGQLRVNGSLIC